MNLRSPHTATHANVRTWHISLSTPLLPEPTPLEANSGRQAEPCACAPRVGLCLGQSSPVVTYRAPVETYMLHIYIHTSHSLRSGLKIELDIRG